MNTQQTNMMAKFTKPMQNAIQPKSKEMIARYLVIDKETERKIVDCRVYMGRSSSASVVYAALWISFDVKQCRDENAKAWQHGYTTGNGKAGGYGYHKASAAVQDAIASAGIELYGSAYTGTSDYNYATKTLEPFIPDFTVRASISGVGSEAIRSALLAIAFAAGYDDCIFVS